ncbi:4-amino-4-deoxy-L-arabinose-phosphoundecaprenol flippase subunit ArnE [Eubacteriaceae bacterium CHKCI004]|nr:4-amino-4-deoxy-L-arabinose-phosphoundecaprenol flippase subunit ArnE [Eubacteriaceae bacterium CHKCI004]
MMCFMILIFMTLCGAVASLFLKRASGTEGILKMFLNINLYIGGGLYLISAVLNVYILRYLDYSVVLPLTSITYIWTMILSYMILKEKITVKKMLGVALILIGAVFVSM